MFNHHESDLLDSANDKRNGSLRRYQQWLDDNLCSNVFTADSAEVRQSDGRLTHAALNLDAQRTALVIEANIDIASRIRERVL